MADAEPKPLACVIGDIDLVRPLGLEGIGCAVVAPAGDPARHSRFTRAKVDWLVDCWEDHGPLVERLVRFARAQAAPPVLFCQTDSSLILVSRHRAQLEPAFRLAVAEAPLIEDLCDKGRFQALSDRLDLPVPPARRLRPSGHSAAPELDLAFPLVVKPLTRHYARWAPLEPAAKALRVDSAAAWRALWPQLAHAGVEVLAQQLVPGPEAAIESYHVYVDANGDVGGEFTGRKLRTYPREYGHTSALVVAPAADVADAGREVIRRLGLRGVAKVDFKRDARGELHLLEVNPRFSLWHHAGALAGVNLPAIAYTDLCGLPPPRAAPARRPVQWCEPFRDAAAARAHQLPLRRWAGWVLRCEARSGFARDDPMPAIRGALPSLWRRVERRLRTRAVAIRTAVEP